MVDFASDTEVTGFSLAEIDLALDHAAVSDRDRLEHPEDIVSLAIGSAVSRFGDPWHLVKTGCYVAALATRTIIYC